MRDSCITRFHPNSNAEEAQTLRALGEYRYNQTRLRKSLAWIRAHPARAANLTLQRIWFSGFPQKMASRDIGSRDSECSRYTPWRWRPSRSVSVSEASDILRHVPAAWIALFPLIYYLVQFEYRYRYPLLWTTCLLAAEAIRLMGCRLRLQPRKT